MAGRIPQQFIDDLLNRVDIVEVVDSRVPLKKKGKEYTACCPFHSEKTPSFTVSQGKQFYHCFGCKASGSAIGFLMEYEHLSYPEAIEELARSQGIDVPYEGGQRPDPAIKKAQTDLYDLMQQTDQYYQQQLRQHADAQTAVSYLKERGLSGEIAKDFGIGFAPDSWDNLLKALGDTPEREKALVTAGMLIKKDNGKCYDRFRDRIMFPIRDRRGRCIAFGGRILPENKQVGAEAQGSASTAGGRKPEAAKYLNSPETPLFHKGRELYGLYEARQALRDIPRLMVVEGYMDVVALAQFDVRYAVATLGTATTADHLQRLFQLTTEVVFCFDGDRAGKDAAWRALQMCLPEMRDGRETRFMFLPDGEDPDSYIRKIGKEAFELEVKQSQSFSEYLFTKLTDEADMIGFGGRAKLVEIVQAMLSQMPKSVYRQVIFNQLEKVGRVKLSPPQAETSRRFKPSRKPGKKTATSMSPVRKAITLLLNQPSIAQHWLQCEKSNGDELAKLDLPGMDLLLEVLEILRINPDLSTSALIERWRETPSGSHLAKLASEQPELDDSAALEIEFIAVMNALKKQSIDLRYDDLQAKLDHGSLDEAEMAEYKMLLQQIYIVKSASKPD